MAVSGPHAACLQPIYGGTVRDPFEVPQPSSNAQYKEIKAHYLTLDRNDLGIKCILNKYVIKVERPPCRF